MATEDQYNPEELILDSAIFDYIDDLDYPALVLVHHMPEELPVEPRTAGEWLTERRDLAALIVRFEAGLSRRRLKVGLDPRYAEADLSIEDIGLLQLAECRRFRMCVSASWFRVTARLEQLALDAPVTPLHVIELCLWASHAI